MKTIQDLAREAGAAQDEGLTYFEKADLQLFHDAAIAQYRERLLAGVGEAVAWLKKWDSVGGAGNGVRRVDLRPDCEAWMANMPPTITPLYTADQMAAAVAIERERCAQICDERERSNLYGIKECAAAIRGPRPSPKHSLDRIDNNLPYGPDNCRWATAEVQHNNTSANSLVTYQGETKTVAQWAKTLGIKQPTLYSRLRRGFSIEQCLTTGRLK